MNILITLMLQRVKLNEPIKIMFMKVFKENNVEVLILSVTSGCAI